MKYPQIGFTIERFKGIEPSVLLGLTRLLGLEFAELTRSVFDDLERVVQKLEGMQTGFHLPLIHEDGWDLSCIDHREDIENLIGQVNRHKEDLRIAHCITHPPEPSLSDKPLRTSSDFLISNLQKLTPPVYLENVPAQPMEDFLVLYKHARELLGPKLLGVCFDASHCYLHGLDPVAQLDNLNGYIGCVHLSDCLPDKDQHLAFGLGGVLPVDEILNKLRELNYRGFVNLEILPRSFDDLEPAIHSYLMVLKALRPRKYLTTKLRMLFVKPLLRHVLK